MKNNLKIIRQAAIELESLDKGEVVKIAGVVKRVVNWFKGFGDPEFQSKLKQLQDMSPQIKGLVDNLSVEIGKFNKALDNTDPEQFGKSLEAVRPLIADLAGQLSDLDTAAERAMADAPLEAVVNSDGETISGDDVKRLQRGWKKDTDLVGKMQSLLPEELDVPIKSHINKPMQDFTWFQQFEPKDIRFSDKAGQWAIDEIAKTVYDIGDISSEKLGNLVSYLNKNKLYILNQLRENIINGTVRSYGFPSEGQPNNMSLVVDAGTIKVPGLDFDVMFPTVFLNDRFASISPIKELDVAALRNVRPYSNYSEQKQELDEGIIKDVLEKNNWNIASAARELGIGERSLRRKMQEFGIEKNELVTEESIQDAFKEPNTQEDEPLEEPQPEQPEETEEERNQREELEQEAKGEDMDSFRGALYRKKEFEKLGGTRSVSDSSYDSVASIKGLDKKSPQFIAELIAVGNRLNIDPSFLASVMLSESGFNHTAVNPMGGATGLIQFMPACVSVDTEILTIDGWKLYDQVSIGDEILSFNEEKNAVEKDQILSLYEYDSISTYRMHNKQFDFISTHNHRWYCDYNGKTVVKTTEELSKLNSKYKIIRSAPFEGGDSLNMKDEFFELLGIVIGDGSVDKRHFSKQRNGGVTIYQSLKAKPQVVKRIQHCLDSLYGEGKYTYSKHQDGMVRWFIKSIDSLAYYVFLNDEKVINKKMLFKLSKSQLNALKSGYLITDGTMQYGKYENFVQCHEERMRDFQLICFLLGETANVKEYVRKNSVQKFPSGNEYIIKPIKYYCNVKKRASLTETRKCRMNYDKVQGRVKVWCPQTGNKTWIARRNGYVTVTGNTAKQMGTTTDELAAMTDVQQLAYVERFFKPFAGRIKTPGDLYMATFLPIFVGKPNNYIIGQKDNHDKIAGNLTYHKVWEYNKTFDTDKDGIVRVGDVTGRANKYYSAGKARGMLTPQTVDQNNQIAQGKGMVRDNQNIPTAPAVTPGSDTVVLDKEDASELFKFLYAAGPIEKIVRRAIYKKALPTTKILITVGSTDIPFHSRVRFAKILSSALRIELDAESSIHNYGDKIEIESYISGSQKNVMLAARGMCEGVSEAFELSTEKCGSHKIGTRIYSNIKSAYALIDSGTMETCFRKFAFDMVSK